MFFCANSAHWRKIPYRLWKLKCDFRQIPVLPERDHHKNQAKSYELPIAFGKFSDCLSKKTGEDVKR